MVSFLVLLLTSCDSFLDIQPVGKVIPTTAEEYRALLAKAYKAVPNDRGFIGFRSDEMQVINEEYSQNKYGDLEIWNDASSKTSFARTDWKNYYHVLFIVNQIIENRDKIESKSKAEVDQLIGESFLLRAYMHFLLVNLHGEPYTKEGAKATKAIPIVLDTDTEKERKRNSVEECYTAILKDIETAKQLLNVEKWDNSFSYRFTPAAAEALSARVHLYMGDWEKSSLSAKEVLKQSYKLEDLNGEAPLLPNHYTSTENITAIELVFPSDVKNATVIPLSFIKKYKEGDKRKELFFTKEENKEGSEVKYKPNKGGTNHYTTTFRLAEVLLTAAEAEAQLNKLAEAKEFLLQLAIKRYSSVAYNALANELEGMNQKELLNFILDERARELVNEGHRWFDLRRTKRPEIVKNLKGEVHTLKQDDPRYTIPIPPEAIYANPNLAN